ncbi:MAG: hypothetical protein AAF141_06125 [Pseudomonadota bacterium]
MVKSILYFLMSVFVGAVSLACMMVILPHALWLDPSQSSASFPLALKASISVIFTFGFPLWLLITLTSDRRGSTSRKGGAAFGALAGLAAWSYQYSGDPTLWWLAGFLSVSGGLAGMFYAGLEVSNFEEADAERRARWISAQSEFSGQTPQTP